METIKKKKQRVKKHYDIINRKAVKKYILRRAKDLRPGWDCRRVGEEALNDINFMLERKIDSMLSRHPTRGKTFSQVI